MLSTRRAVVATCLALALGLSAGCSGSAGSEASPTTVPSSTPTVTVSPDAAPDAAADAAVAAAEPLTQAQLEDALLTAADLPAGFTKEPEEPESEEDTGCAALDDLTERTKSGPEAAVGFAHDDGVYLSEALETMPTATAAEEFAEGQAAFAGCSTLSMTDDESGEQITFDVEPMKVPDLGDGSFGFRATTTYQGFEVEMHNVYIRVGTTLVGVSNTAFGADADADLTDELLVKDSLAKLDGTLPTATAKV